MVHKDRAQNGILRVSALQGGGLSSQVSSPHDWRDKQSRTWVVGNGSGACLFPWTGCVCEWLPMWGPERWWPVHLPWWLKGADRQHANASLAFLLLQCCRSGAQSCAPQGHPQPSSSSPSWAECLAWTMEACSEVLGTLTWHLYLGTFSPHFLPDEHVLGSGLGGSSRPTGGP